MMMMMMIVDTAYKQTDRQIDRHSSAHRQTDIAYRETDIRRTFL